MSVSHGEVASATPYDLYIQFDRLADGWPGAADWPEIIPLTCGFQSVELLCALLRDAVADERTTSGREHRIDRLADVVELALTRLGEMLAEAKLPPWAALPPGTTQQSPGLTVLSALPLRHRDRMTQAFGRELGRLSFRLGVEAHFGQGEAEPGDDRPVFDYCAFVAPHSLAAVGRPHPFGPEDRLFCTAHQITECWLRITRYQIEQAERASAEGGWADAAQHVRAAAAAVDTATRAARLLDVMVLADYHPLRVRLRDGSGAQSKAAQGLPTLARRAHKCLLHALDETGISLLTLLDEPAAHPGLHGFQAALQDLGRRCQAFLFEHYLLANSVLGETNLGSLGYAVRVLSERAAHPLFEDLDQAKHDLTVITNLRHGGESGSLVLENELAVRPGLYDRPEPAAGPDPATIRDRVQRYFTQIEKRDPAGWTELFAQDAVFRDSAAGRPYAGRRHLRVFIDTTLDLFSEMRPRLGEIRVEGSHAEVDWSFTAVALGVPVEFGGREQFDFDEDSLIRQARVIWDPSAIAAQLWPAKAAAPL